MVAIRIASRSRVSKPQKPAPRLENDTAPKKAIVAFAEHVTKEGSRDFVPAGERIATFGTDGTLRAEQTMDFQLLFARELERIVALL